jgi:hypothetical protein
VQRKKEKVNKKPKTQETQETKETQNMTWKVPCFDLSLGEERSEAVRKAIQSKRV